VHSTLAHCHLSWRQRELASQNNARNGSFELKEHFVTIGLGLPANWYYRRRSLAPDTARIRVALTSILAFIVWWAFLVGHVINNIRASDRETRMWSEFVWLVPT
jgi:hypothetical protein